MNPQLATTGSDSVLSRPLPPLSTSSIALSNVSLSHNASIGLFNISIHPARALLGVLLSIFTGMTVFGNFLVIYAVVRQRYLRTITNYFIVSLATADLLMGIAVMPIAVIREVTQISVWPFGQDLCDLWHALDVLSSTASIINLCLIALERYWATENPITYPTRMTKTRCLFMIAGGWVCSSAISFPAIIWWRHVDEIVPYRCEFTSDSYFLAISSIVSFYVPLVIMVIVYYRIYRTATNLIRSFNAGAKVIYKNGTRGGEVMVLRIHRGRNPPPHHPAVQRTRSEGEDPHDEEMPFHASRVKRSHNDVSSGASDSSTLVNATSNVNSALLTATDSPARHSGGQPSTMVPMSPNDGQSANKCITRKLRKFAVGRRLIKFNREQKAAKTLGIVMGIFIACWLPFFICNIITAVDSNFISPTVNAFVTWLGYINSSINPVIYAHSMRDFRRAFLKLLCSCYLRRQRRTRGFVLRSNCYNSNTYASPNSSCRNPNFQPVPSHLPATGHKQPASSSPNRSPNFPRTSSPSHGIANPAGMDTSFTSTSTILTVGSPFRVAGASVGGNNSNTGTPGGFNGYLTPSYTPLHRSRGAARNSSTEAFATSEMR